MPRAVEGTGVLILRVWSEVESAHPLRIRITRLDEVARSTGNDPESYVVQSIDEAVDAVRDFVASVERATTW